MDYCKCYYNTNGCIGVYFGQNVNSLKREMKMENKECNCNIDVDNSFAFEILKEFKEQNKRLEEKDKRHTKTLIMTFIISMITTTIIIFGVLFYFGTFDFSNSVTTNGENNISNVGSSGIIIDKDF